jgi:hypothetical protein
VRSQPRGQAVGIGEAGLRLGAGIGGRFARGIGGAECIQQGGAPCRELLRRRLVRFQLERHRVDAGRQFLQLVLRRVAAPGPACALFGNDGEALRACGRGIAQAFEGGEGLSRSRPGFRRLRASFGQILREL